MKLIVMIATAVAAVAALLLIASGCGDTAAGGSSAELSLDKYNQIQVGMGTNQLIGLVGEPSKKEAKNMSGGHSMGGDTMSGSAMNMEYWYYQGSKGWVRLEVAEDKVTSKSGY